MVYYLVDRSELSLVGLMEVRLADLTACQLVARWVGSMDSPMVGQMVVHSAVYLAFHLVDCSAASMDCPWVDLLVFHSVALTACLKAE